jgi:hypothetical protein
VFFNNAFSRDDAVRGLIKTNSLLTEVNSKQHS